MAFVPCVSAKAVSAYTKGTDMREIPHGDGTVAIYADLDDGDALFIEPVLIEFTPMNGSLRCACGAKLKAWDWRQVAADRAELICSRCHCIGGVIRLATRTRR